MENKSIIRDIESLPPEAQQEIRSFISYLKQYYSKQESEIKSNKMVLNDAPLFRAWKGLTDSEEYSLDKLLEQINVQNIHNEVGTGKIMGKEII